jgi:predicted acetyltransferase
VIPDYRYSGSFHLYRADGNYKDFEVAYQAFAENYNTMVHRDSYDWGILKAANPFKGDRSAYLYKDSTGKPCGYLIFDHLQENDKLILDCKELIFDSFLTLKAIMSFVKTFSADYSKFQFTAPSSLNLDYFCEDYAKSATGRTLLQNGMVRVVNVMQVLKQAIYKGSGEIKLLIYDSYLNENEKIYHIVYKNGIAIQITDTPVPASFYNKESLGTSLSGEATLVNPDIEMTINQFSAAIVGKYNVTDFDYQEGITLYCSKEKASDLFYRKPCWIHNYF